MENQTLETVESQVDYRAMREGREPAKPIESEAKPPAENKQAPPAGEAESAGVSETPKEHVEEQKGSEDGDSQQNKEGEKKAGKKGGLVDEVIALRRENRDLRTRLAPPPQAQPQAQPKPAPPAEPAADDVEPDISKYTDYDKYQRDVVRFEVRKAQREGAAAEERRKAEVAELNKRQTWNDRIRAAIAEIPDFEAVALNTTLPVPKSVGDVIMRSDIGPKVLFELGSNPEEALRIAKLDPIDQTREILAIEYRLKKAAEPPPADEALPPQKETVSSAPPPIPRPNASPARPNPTKNLESISQSEYRALRESGRLR